jgi:hypothetical protein
MKSPTIIKSTIERNPKVNGSVDIQSKSKHSYGLSTLQKRNLDINPKGSPRHTIIYKDPFTAKSPAEKLMNKIDNMKDINVDLFRPENQHLLEKWERNLNTDPFIMR